MAVNSRRGVNGASGGFTYKPRSAEAASARMERYSSGNRDNYLDGNVTTYTPKEGDNWLRILPPTWPNAEHYALDLYVHYEVGPDNNTYLCPEKMRGIPCPLCAELKRAKAAGESEYARALDSGLRLAAYIVDREGADKGVQLWMYSPTIDREILEQSRDRRTGEILMIDNPATGYDIEFKRTGKGLHTKYTGIKIARQPSPIEDKYIDYAVANPIPNLLKFYDADHIAVAFGSAPVGASSTQIDESSPPYAEEEAVAAEARLVAVDKPAEKVAAPAAVGPASPAPAANRRQRLAPKTAGIDFSKMDINAQLDWADSHDIVVPEDIADEGIAAFLAEEAAKKGITA